MSMDATTRQRFSDSLGRSGDLMSPVSSTFDANESSFYSNLYHLSPPTVVDRSFRSTPRVGATVTASSSSSRKTQHVGLGLDLDVDLSRGFDGTPAAAGRGLHTGSSSVPGKKRLRSDSSEEALGALASALARGRTRMASSPLFLGDTGMPSYASNFTVSPAATGHGQCWALQQHQPRRTMEELLPEDLEVADVLLNISSSSPRSGALPAVEDETSSGSRSSGGRSGSDIGADDEVVDVKMQQSSAWGGNFDNDGGFLPLDRGASSTPASRASSVSSKSGNSSISFSTSSSSADSD